MLAIRDPVKEILVIIFCILVPTYGDPISLFSSEKENYHMLWHDERKIIVSSGEHLLIVSVKNTSRVFRVLEWPTTTFGYATSRGERTSPFVSAIEIYYDVYEVCGFIGVHIHCHLYINVNDSWTWIATKQSSISNDPSSYMYEYHDGNFLLVYSTLSGYSPGFQLRTAFTSFQSPENLLRIDNDPSRKEQKPLEWWRQLIETRNHGHFQFNPGPQLRFHGFAVAPGRRYLIFSEAAQEAENRESLWSIRRKQASYVVTQYSFVEMLSCRLVGSWQKCVRILASPEITQVAQ
ncbi:hypothetical protein AHF37_11614 [Paragonimus kellicotti]|nr:hypothetical protein AHF37_11614 [Paragonimus kellicotti]